MKISLSYENLFFCDSMVVF